MKILINTTGHVEYVREMSTTIHCQMYLQAYPLDSQNCPMILQRFKYESNELRISWLGSDENINGHLSRHQMPLVINKRVKLDSWNLVEVVASNCSEEMVPDMRSCLKMEFAMNRRSGFSIFQVGKPQHNLS